MRVFVNGVAIQEMTVQTDGRTRSTSPRCSRASGTRPPLGAELTTVAITVTGRPTPVDPTTPAVPALATASARPDPFNTRVVVGCVTLAGTAASRADVGEMVIRLGDAGLFVEPFISTTTTDETEGVVQRFGRPVREGLQPAGTPPPSFWVVPMDPREPPPPTR